MKRIFHQIKDPDLSKFWTILVVSNPMRFLSRYDLFLKAKKQFEGKNLIVVEMAFGDREFEITEKDNKFHLQFRSWDELWQKENMINRGIEYLSQIAPDWEYVAWVDADVIFQREDFLEETWHELQHHMIVQMFQTAVDLGPEGEAHRLFNSFAWNYCRGVSDVDSNGYYYGYIGHPGFCWAARREAVDTIGQLIDFAILGSGDHHMALGLIGRIHASYPKDVTPSYKIFLHTWEERAKALHKDIGFVHGTITHMWHGKKKNRKYKERWEILVQDEYSPIKDIKRDSQGLYTWSGHNQKLRDDIRKYFRQRNEDSIDCE